jgi:hypothetical protein
MSVRSCGEIDMDSRAFLTGLVMYALAALPAVAQSSPFGSYTIHANTTLGQLSIQQSAAGPGQIEGTILGDRLEGYFALGSRQVVWIRYSGSTPAQAYVGTHSGQSTPALPSIPNIRSSELQGTFYALSGSGGASPQRNAWGFRAWGPFTLQQNPLPPNINPPASSTPHPAPAGPWWVTGNQSESTLALEVAADGAVTGWIFGEPIVGHYASVAGTIAFLRLHNGQPIQFYQGRSVQIDFDPITGQGIFELQGSFFALDEANGGASQASNEFLFNARNQWGYFTWRSALSGLCLEIENSATGDHARLRQNTCTSAPNQQLSFVRTGFRGASAPSVFVARHSGRCLDVPNGSTATGELIQQFYCHGGNNQQVIAQAVATGGDCPAGRDSCPSLRFIHSQKCITVTGLGAANEVIQGDCNQDDPAIMFDSTFVPP